ncbi:MAG: hypothetical protein ACJAVK_003562, partial [Akkermansiaceae bacterium]
MGLRSRFREQRKRARILVFKIDVDEIVLATQEEFSFREGEGTP